MTGYGGNGHAGLARRAAQDGGPPTRELEEAGGGQLAEIRALAADELHLIGAQVLERHRVARVGHVRGG